MTNTEKLRPYLLLFVMLAAILMLSACAKGEPVEACLTGHEYRFWGGLLHGIIAPFDLLGMIFRDNVVVYAPNNNGAWYAFGFLLGSGGWGILGSRGSKKRKH